MNSADILNNQKKSPIKIFNCRVGGGGPLQNSSQATLWTASIIGLGTPALHVNWYCNFIPVKWNTPISPDT